jgi:hypothetical protein
LASRLLLLVKQVRQNNASQCSRSQARIEALHVAVLLPYGDEFKTSVNGRGAQSYVPFDGDEHDTVLRIVLNRQGKKAPAEGTLAECSSKRLLSKRRLLLIGENWEEGFPTHAANLPGDLVGSFESLASCKLAPDDRVNVIWMRMDDIVHEG